MVFWSTHYHCRSRSAIDFSSFLYRFPDQWQWTQLAELFCAQPARITTLKSVGLGNVAIDCIDDAMRKLCRPPVFWLEARTSPVPFPTNQFADTFFSA